MVAIFAADLGLIEGLGSLAQKLVGIDILGLGIASDARAGGKLKRYAADHDRHRSGFKKLPDHLQTLVRIVEIAEHGDELVSAEASEGIVLLHRGLHAMGNGGEEFVADRVAVTIVDRLEVVEIETNDSQDAAAAIGLGDRLVQAIAKLHAIGQTGKQVVQCHALQVPARVPLQT